MARARKWHSACQPADQRGSERIRAAKSLAPTICGVIGGRQTRIRKKIRPGRMPKSDVISTNAYQPPAERPFMVEADAQFIDDVGKYRHKTNVTPHASSAARQDASGWRAGATCWAAR